MARPGLPLATCPAPEVGGQLPRLRVGSRAVVLRPGGVGRAGRTAAATREVRERRRVSGLAGSSVTCPNVASLPYLNNKDKRYFYSRSLSLRRRRPPAQKVRFSSRTCALTTGEKSQICFPSDRV